MFKEEHSATLQTCGTYLLKRIKRLYVPFVFWGGLFVLLHNLFIRLHVYSLTPLAGDVLEKQVVSKWWSTGEIASRFIKTLVMQDGMEGIAGAFWFLRALFFASVLYCFVDYILRKCFRQFIGNGANEFMSMVALFALILSRYEGYRHFISMICFLGGNKTLTAFALIHLGRVLKRYHVTLEKKNAFQNAFIFLIGGSILCILSLRFHVELNVNRYPTIVLLLLCTILGWLFLESLARLILSGRKWIGFLCGWLIYVGCHTMPVVIFHFLSFKLVSLVGVLYYRIPLDEIAAFPYRFRGIGWCFAYTVAGVAIPICLSSLCHCFVEVLSKRQ